MRKKHAAVRSIPKSRRGEWPRFLVLPGWAADDLDGPTMKKWTIYFQGVRPSGKTRWFIWQIWGLRHDWKDVRQRLSDRAAEFGLTCVYMYGIAKPMNKEMYDAIVESNAAMQPHIVKLRQEIDEWHKKRKGLDAA